MQPAHGLDVVVEDLGLLGQHQRQSLLLEAGEVGRQHFDRGARRQLFECPDRGRELTGAAVGQVVAIDRGDDDVAQLHLRRGLGQAPRLVRVGQARGLAGVHVAVAAGAGAGVAENLEGGRPPAPALAHVRALRLLANRVQLLAVQEPAHVAVERVGARGAHFHPLGAARAVTDG